MPSLMNSFESTLADKDFALLRDYFEKLSGVHLNDSKKALVQSRLMGRLRVTGIPTFAEYYRYLQLPTATAEKQMFVDVLTTHETRFYREGKHFEFLNEHIRQNRLSRLRIWCAACSTGEEAYTLAMVLTEIPGLSFEILASDISVSSMDQAQKGLYPPERTSELPPVLKTKYLQNDASGQLKVAEIIKRKVTYRQINLMEKLPADLGQFDFVFLRNMLIYFDLTKQKQIVSGVLGHLKSGGLLFVGHSEALIGADLSIKSIKPSVYKKQ